jgi:hypothetical protein
LGVLLVGLALIVFGPRLFPAKQPGTTGIGPAETAVKTLTVAQSAAAEYRSLNEALREARPGDTVSVQDDAVYKETILIRDPDKHRGITVESRRGAVIAPGAEAGAAITIGNTPDVSVRGFRVHVGVDQHAVRILGEAAGVTLEDLDLRQPAESVWCAIHITEQARGEPANPIRIRNSTFRSGLMGIVIEGEPNGAVSCVHVENNRFERGAGAHVLVNRAAQRIVVRGNVFIGQGVIISLTEAGDCGPIHVGNNTFLGGQKWLELFGTDSVREGIVYNNLVLGATTIEIDRPLASLGEKWTFLNNWWERSESTDSEIAAVVAEVRDAVDLMSREPSDESFLYPRPDSPLTRSGVGGDFPDYVGAFPALHEGQ